MRGVLYCCARTTSRFKVLFLSFSFSTMVTKAASDASHIIKDKVGNTVATNLITEFNREQEEFIKTKGQLPILVRAVPDRTLEL